MSGKAFETPEKGKGVQIRHQIKVNSSCDAARVEAQPLLSSLRDYRLLDIQRASEVYSSVAKPPRLTQYSGRGGRGYTLKGPSLQLTAS